MKILIEESVLRQALEALVKYQTRQSMDDLEYAGYAGDTAITALRTALDAAKVCTIQAKYDELMASMKLIAQSRVVEIAKSALEKDWVTTEQLRGKK